MINYITIFIIFRMFVYKLLGLFKICKCFFFVVPTLICMPLFFMAIITGVSYLCLFLTICLTASFSVLAYHRYVTPALTDANKHASLCLTYEMMSEAGRKSTLK